MRRLAIALAVLAILPIAAKADELSDMKAALSAAMGSIQRSARAGASFGKGEGHDWCHKAGSQSQSCRADRSKTPPAPAHRSRAGRCSRPETRCRRAGRRNGAAGNSRLRATRRDLRHQESESELGGDLAALTDPGELPAGWNRSRLRQKRRYELQRPGKQSGYQRLPAH